MEFPLILPILLQCFVIKWKFSQAFSPLLSSPQVTTDKKSLAYVDNMLKKSNKKVEELHQELQELNAHIVVKDPEELLGNNSSKDCWQS